MTQRESEWSMTTFLSTNQGKSFSLYHANKQYDPLMEWKGNVMAYQIIIPFQILKNNDSQLRHIFN